MHRFINTSDKSDLLVTNVNLPSDKSELGGVTKVNLK